jgi:hypothetical protein
VSVLGAMFQASLGALRSFFIAGYDEGYMRAKRVCVADGIVCDILPPKKQSKKVMIFCSGLPSMPGKDRALVFARKHGYWGVNFRYRGTWESSGRFLAHSPEQDVFDVIESLKGELVDVWSEEVFKIDVEAIVVVGASFGGAVALCCANDPRVKKVVALSPVIDWTAQSQTEPPEYLLRVIQKGYGGAFRFTDQDWERLFCGEICQPKLFEEAIDSAKVLVIFTKDDAVVPFGPTQEFVKNIDSKAVCLKKGGHLGSSSVMDWKIGRAIRRFL